ncbi:MAG TPA: 1,2-phenylacetyl-CoA epoxidase subunit PaaC [Acetobacteraceae bacterium]|nr:1,2-phenylacetyl-CoA epoxidase subunit PaaC [Acetobacteraceae bacterium]
MAATTSIAVEETPLALQLLCRADDALILGHRLSEWTGYAPTLEEELALANIALDLIGQARALYSYAGTLTGHTEDQLAYLRDAPAWRNCLMVELPNGDFAFSIARLLLVSAFADPFWHAATASTDSTIAAVAAKAEKETAYHLRHAAEWLIRLGDGTAESHCRAQTALDNLWPYTGELFTSPPSDGDIAPDPMPLRETWSATVSGILARATLKQPPDGWMQSGGRTGRHTEHLGHLLAEMQFLQRTYPGASW